MEGVNVTLSAILNRLNTEGRDGGRTLVASFMGSMYTHPTRHKLETMKSADIQITATDWCVAAQSPPPQSLSAMPWHFRLRECASVDRADSRSKCGGVSWCAGR